MFKTKYSTVLTIILTILIVAILIICIFLGINTYKEYNEKKIKEQAVAELKENPWKEESDAEEKPEGTNEPVLEPIEVPTKPVVEPSSPRREIPLYKNEYPMIGTIKIPKTGIELPILLDTSIGALEASVGVMYPTNPELNKPGNVVIIGHNYRNGKFFSDNKKLSTGDKIQITDLTGKTLTYTIYEMFETDSTDTEYITRDRGNSTEISLSTCTDKGDRRLVILAKVK